MRLKKLSFKKDKKDKKETVTNIPIHIPFCHKKDGVCYLRITNDEKICVGCGLFY